MGKAQIQASLALDTHFESIDNKDQGNHSTPCCACVHRVIINTSIILCIRSNINAHVANTVSVQ